MLLEVEARKVLVALPIARARTPVTTVFLVFTVAVTTSPRGRAGAFTAFSLGAPVLRGSGRGRARS
jgi:hypothetical protein